MSVRCWGEGQWNVLTAVCAERGTMTESTANPVHVTHPVHGTGPDLRSEVFSPVPDTPAGVQCVVVHETDMSRGWG